MWFSHTCEALGLSHYSRKKNKTKPNLYTGLAKLREGKRTKELPTQVWFLALHDPHALSNVNPKPCTHAEGKNKDQGQNIYSPGRGQVYLPVTETKGSR